MDEPIKARVLHLGNHADHAGGIAAVIDEYLAWDWPGSVHDVADTYASDPRQHGWRPAFRAARLLVRSSRLHDVVHVHLSQRGSFIREGGLLRLASRIGIPVVATVHGSSFVGFAADKPRRAAGVLRRADAVIVLSPDAGQVARALGSRSVHMVPNGVAGMAPAAVPFEERETFVFAGEVSPRKGIDVLLEAWSEVSTESMGHLDIYGPQLAEAVPSVPERAVIHGIRPRDEVREAMRNALAVVLPSRAEGFPMALVEAMAAGVPVATTDVGGISWLLDDPGQLVDPEDSAQLAALLRRYLDDRTFAAERGAANHARHAAMFTPAAVMATLESVYQQVMRRGDAP